MIWNDPKHRGPVQRAIIISNFDVPTEATATVIGAYALKGIWAFLARS